MEMFAAGSRYKNIMYHFFCLGKNVSKTSAHTLFSTSLFCGVSNVHGLLYFDTIEMVTLFMFLKVGIFDNKPSIMSRAIISARDAKQKGQPLTKPNMVGVSFDI